MDIRKALHARPGVTVAILVIGVGSLIYIITRAQRGPTPHYTNPGLYYSADDGKTFHANAPELVPPFEEDGKTWVRARVFVCGKNQPFVGYLEQYSVEAQRRLASIDKQALRYQYMEQVGDGPLMVKRPGDSNWVPKLSAAGLTNVTCPGSSEPAKEITPENWKLEK